MVRNFMHLGVGQVTTTILTALLSAVLARILTPAEFGLMFLLYSIAAFTFVVIDWGHGSLVIREASRHPERSGELFGTTLVLRTIGTLFAFPIVIGVTWLLGYDAMTRALAGIMILASLPQYLGLSFGWIFRAHERMDRDAQINVVFKFANLVCAVICLVFGGRVPALVLAYGVAGCITAAVAATFYRKLQLPKIAANRRTAKELMRDGSAIFAMTLAIAIEPVFNANILYKMSSPEVVGWYGAAWTIAGTLIAPATVLATAMYPRLSPAAGDPVEFKRLVSISFRPLFLLAALGAAGTYLFADVPVAIIFGMPKFAPAADILRAFAVLLLLMYANLFLSTTALALGKASQLAMSKIGAVALVVGLAFYLVPLCQERFGNGGLGVIFAMVLGEFLMVVASWVLVRDYLDGRTVSDIVRSMAAGGATILLLRPLADWTPFVTIPICLALFAGLAWLTGAMRKTDIDMLMMSVRKSPAPAKVETGAG